MGKAEIEKVETKAGAARVQCPGAMVEICPNMFLVAARTFTLWHPLAS
jgi:hypothetical protein